MCLYLLTHFKCDVSLAGCADDWVCLVASTLPRHLSMYLLPSPSPLMWSRVVRACNVLLDQLRALT